MIGLTERLMLPVANGLKSYTSGKVAELALIWNASAPRHEPYVREPQRTAGYCSVRNGLHHSHQMETSLSSLSAWRGVRER